MEERSDEMFHFSGDHLDHDRLEDSASSKIYNYASSVAETDFPGNNSQLCTVHVNEQRTAFLSRNSVNEPFGFALQTYVFKRDPSGLTERITYVDYVRDNSIAANGGVRRGDVVVAVNGFPVLAESHMGLVKLMSSQLKLCLVLIYQDITRILALSVRSLQLQYILAEKYILLEQVDMEEASILNGSGGSLSTDFRRARWLSICQDISKSLNMCRGLLGRESKRDFCHLQVKPSTTTGRFTILERGDDLDDDCSEVTRL